MFYWDHKIYQKENEEGKFRGFIALDNFFAVLETGEGLEEDKGQEMLKVLHAKIAEADITSLDVFENFVSDYLKSADIPAHFALACGFLKDNILLLKVFQDAQIYLKRDGRAIRLIDQNKSASGYIKEGDVFIFSTKDNFEKAEEPDNGIVLSLTFKKNLDMVPEQTAVPVSEPPVEREKRTMTIAALFVILLIFIWSVVLGYQRRTTLANKKKIEVKSELITQKLSQAEEVAFLNISRAQILVSEAKQELTTLKKEVGADNKEVALLEKLVNEKENSIFKKEEKKYEEFFDLSVEDKKAKGDEAFLDGENLAILDKSGAVYTVSLKKKSIDKKRFEEVKGAQLVSIFEDEVFIYRKGKGIYKIANDKIKKVIDNDKEWGQIKDMSSYNGNIYLLDAGKDDLYKYLPTDESFSSKTSYFTARQGVSVRDARSFSIDLSVYVNIPDQIFKFTSGARDGYANSFTDESIDLEKVFADKETEKVYAWDKQKGIIYILSRTGDYEGQIKSSILKNVSDFVIFEKNIYAVLGPKIYKISLD